MKPDSSSATVLRPEFVAQFQELATLYSANLLNSCNTCPLTINLTKTWHSGKPSHTPSTSTMNTSRLKQFLQNTSTGSPVFTWENVNVSIAEALHQEYCRRRAEWKGYKRALQTLDEKYTNIQCFMTPIHCLPIEILMRIFYIIFDDHPSAVVLMLVCRRWHNAIEEIPGLQTFVDLHTWTTPDIVRRATNGVTSRLLNITIDTDKDDELGGSSIERYSTIAIAIENIPQWRSLTIHSLPGGEQLGDSALHNILSTDIPPMTRLEELRITSEVDPSPLVDRLLQSIAATAMSGLTTMDANCSYSSRYLLRVTSACTFHSLTTLKAVLPKASEPIDILPRFTRLEVLEVTNLSLPSYQNDFPLPFSQTLRRLRLKSVTIDWMAGRVFPLLSFCAIVTPPSPFLAHDVHLPTCREFHFSRHCTALFGRFQMPMVSFLVIHSNHWTPLRGSQGLANLCMAGLGAALQPRVLHLAMLCNVSVLRMVLQDLPALEELNLELPRPSALSRGFFTSLLAKPVTIDPYGTRKSGWFVWAENQNDWHVAICPSLKVFNLHYQRWLRPNEQFGFVAPLLALGWSRKKTENPLQTLCVHMKMNHGNWKRVELVSIKPEHLLELDIPQLQYLTLDQGALQFVLEAYLTSATFSAIEVYYGIDPIPHLTEAVFGTSFNRMRVLSVQDLDEEYTLDVLHCFHHLEELSLKGVQIMLYSDDIDFPLLQTLQRLHIHGGCAKWMDGLIFVQLKYFSVRFISSWCHSFPKRVDMPVCTNISYDLRPLEFLPIFQAAFVLPLMREWTLQGLFFRNPLVDGVHTFSEVHARVLRLSCNTEIPQLVMVIQPRYELEELSICLHSHLMAKEFLIALTEVIVDCSMKKPTKTSNFATQAIPKLEDAIEDTCNQSEGKPICPNLKILGLQCRIFGDKQRDEVTRRCVEMMEGRRRAGCPLDRCCIWWEEADWWHSYDFETDWKKEPSLVLFTSNEG